METLDPSEDIFDESEDVNVKLNGKVKWTSNSGLILQGFCKKEYSPVKDLFESYFKAGREKNAQLCVYVKNEVVVDLYGTAIEDTSYTPDSLHLIFSSGKSIVAIVIALFVDRGLLDYDEKVCKYWPEFAKNDKDETRLCDILRHESGLSSFNFMHNDHDILRENIKTNSIGAVIENCSQFFPNSSNGVHTKRAYHGITRGFILNEIVRRVDPKGRTIGEIVEEDIGIDGVHLGLNKSLLEKCTLHSARSKRWVMTQSAMPSFMKSRVSDRPMNFVKISQRQKRASKAVNIPKKCFSDWDPNDPPSAHKFLERNEIRFGEIPSANFHGNARGIARLASALANKGKFGDGRQLLSNETWDKMHSKATLALDINLGGKTCFTQGGVNQYYDIGNPHKNTEAKLMGPERAGYYGWVGFGGSVMQWNPEFNIGFGYIPSLLEWYEFNNHKGANLQQLVVECAKTATVESRNNSIDEQ